MAKHLKYSKWGLAAIAGGIALTAIEVVGAVSYLVGQDSPSYLVAGGAMVTVVAAILPILAARCWQNRRYLLALLLWAAMVPALSLVFSAAVERTGSARDGANRDRQVIAQRIELTRRRERCQGRCRRRRGGSKGRVLESPEGRGSSWSSLQKPRGAGRQQPATAEGG